jgi:hypothetical protein
MEGFQMAQEQRSYNWTGDQIKILDEAEAILERALDEARSKMSTIRELTS